MIVGIDIGSLTSKIVLFDGKKILDYKIVRTGSKSISIAKELFDEMLKKNKLKNSDIKCVIATGYGRNNVSFADKQVSEISCHAKGANFLFPQTKTVIDIGGQDSKVIKINNGKVVDFVMNDKCAAGTGRFLEVMARALDIEVEELSKISLNTKKSVSIASICAVFAESEVISYLAKGAKKEEILKGINQAVVSRIKNMWEKVKIEKEVSLSGGVAKNLGVVKTIEEDLGCKVNLPKEPQIIGALGAAVIGYEENER